MLKLYEIIISPTLTIIGGSHYIHSFHSYAVCIRYSSFFKQVSSKIPTLFYRSDTLVTYFQSAPAYIFSFADFFISNLINILSLREEGGSTSIKYSLSFRFYHKTTIFVIFWYIKVTNLELKHARIFMYTLLLLFFVIFFSCI